MNLSQEIRDVLATMKTLSKESEDAISTTVKSRFSYDFSGNNVADELIDTDQFNFINDETWLYESTDKCMVKDLKMWLYHDVSPLRDLDFHNKRLSLIREIAQIDAKKSIDSRTFTRPKKRLNRPSIELYSEGYFKMEKSDTSTENNKSLDDIDNDSSTLKYNECNNTTFSENSIFDENDVTVIHHPQAPLRFDFSQPTTSSIFDKIVANASDIDSFQNMSPPSLVNSMCSSTFTNLMENSMIKNDPVLREIRDADYTEAMLQDYNPPLFKSFSGSCSSINSDSPETFIKQTSDNTLNKIYRGNLSSDKEDPLNQTYIANDPVILDCTYSKDSSSDISSNDVCGNNKDGSTNNLSIHRQAIPTKTIETVPNGTYRKIMNTKLNSTFQILPHVSNDDLNRTIIHSQQLDSNRLISSKRHSYIVDNRNSDLNRTVSPKRNSVALSAGSCDSLDYTSSLSNSSRGSNKMLNMAEVDAIVLQQEQSLEQVNSTPARSSKVVNKLWENNLISPITLLDRGDHFSDSEISSNDDYRTVRSNSSSTPFGSTVQLTASNKNLERVPKNESSSFKNKKSIISNNRKLENNFKGSYTNLKTLNSNLKGSYTSLKPLSANFRGSYTNIATNANSSTKGSNLKTMSNTLKGSYTQLKPVLLNLPCTDTNLKIFNSNPAMISKQPVNHSLKKVSDGIIKIAEVAPTLRDPVRPANFTKPQLKTSGLPRPISSIPRPTSSKIPGPRTIRPTSARQLSRPISKINMDYDF